MILLATSAWRDGTRAMGAPCRCPRPACRRRGPRPAARTTILPSSTIARGGTALTLAWSDPISARASVLTEGGQYTRIIAHHTAPPSCHTTRTEAITAQFDTVIGASAVSRYPQPAPVAKKDIPATSNLEGLNT